MKAIVTAMVKAIQKLLGKRTKPSPNMTPQKIQGQKTQVKPSKQQDKKSPEPSQDGNVDNDNFWTDRVEAGGNKPMRRFYSKHRDRLKNQERGPEQDSDLGY